MSWGRYDPNRVDCVAVGDILASMQPIQEADKLVKGAPIEALTFWRDRQGQVHRINSDDGTVYALSGLGPGDLDITVIDRVSFRTEAEAGLWVQVPDPALTAKVVSPLALTLRDSVAMSGGDRVVLFFSPSTSQALREAVVVAINAGCVDSSL